MSNKKLTANDVSKSLGADKTQTGRKPKRPKGLVARLEQLNKEADSWLRLFREVWFDPSDPIIADAVGSSELSDLSEVYNDALEKMRWISASAEFAQQKLEQGKAKAKKKRADIHKRSER